jgi:hypothetical protein
MTEDEAIFFEGRIINSNFEIPGEDEIYSSGKWFKEKEEKDEK